MFFGWLEFSDLEDLTWMLIGVFFLLFLEHFLSDESGCWSFCWQNLIQMDLD